MYTYLFNLCLYTYRGRYSKRERAREGERETDKEREGGRGGRESLHLW